MSSIESAERAAPEVVTAQDRAALLAALAAELLAKHGPEDAEPVLRYALELDPTCFAAHFARAEALQALDRSAEALSQGWLAYAAARGDSSALIPLPDEQAARARLAAPSSAAAPDRATLARALGFAAAQRPKEAWLTGLVGRLFESAGLPAEAIPWYRRAAAVDPAYDAYIAPALAGCGKERSVQLDRVADSTELRDALRRIPLPAAPSLRCAPLSGGVQNVLIKLTAGDRSFALRLEKFPSAGWYFYAEEGGNAAAAHRAGVAPAIHYFDRADGTQLTEFLAGPMMTGTGFADPGQAAAAGVLYRRLHATDGFRGTFNILNMIAGDQTEYGTFGEAEIADLPHLAEEFTRIRALLDATRGAPCATHNDPIPQNFIAAASGLALLDWQCSALADPHWEIGAFSAQVALPDPAEQAFFAAYFDPADAAGRARALLYKPVCSYFWLGRALIRGAKSADQAWREEAVQSAKRFRELLAEPVFAESVAILSARAG